jgi:hypothetical protein
MLSFMREHGAGNSSDHSSAAAGSPGAPSSGGPEAQEYLTVAANSKSVRRSTTLVAILVGIGLVCLMLMIKKSQPQAASARQGTGDEQKIEAAITRLTGVRSEMTDHMDAIVKKFYEFSDVFQVKVGELVKDPFEVEGFMTRGIRDTAIISEDPQVKAEAIRRQKMQEQAGTLRLLSIMRSDSGHSCMINDQILRQGEVIEGFAVSQIGSHFVELKWLSGAAPGSHASETEAMTITLKLSE